MKSLGKFQLDGTSCRIDLPRLLETRLLVQANSGGGKSWLLRRIFEQTAGAVQQIIIDPEGEFASPREKLDYVIAAPHDGDALAHPKTAQLLARRLLETGVNAVLDIYDLKKHERQAFVRIFCETLMEAPKTLWHPVLVAIDEADLFCPEKGQAESTAAVIDLATRGRKRGFALLAATQRLAKFHKDAAAELLNKLIGRTGLDVDVKRAVDELGFANYRSALNTLRSLEPGDFFAYGPALSQSISLLKVGPVLTTHPKVGDRGLKAPPRPTAAIRAVLPKLADLPKEAETEARTTEELRRELLAARRELAITRRSPQTPAIHPASPPARELLQSAEERGYQRGLVAQKAALLSERRALRSTVLSAVGEAFAKSTQNALFTTPGREQEVPRTRLSAPSVSPTKAQADIHEHTGYYRPKASRPRSSKEHVIFTEEALSGPEQRILNAIAWLETMTASEACHQPAVAFLAGYTMGGGAYNNPRSRLHSRGLVTYAPGERICLTDAGRELAEVPPSPLTEEELHRQVLERLPGPEQRILKPLLAAYPQPMTGPEVAAAASYAYGAGSFNNPRSRLKSLGLIDYVGDGQLVACDCLFPGKSSSHLTTS